VEETSSQKPAFPTTQKTTKVQRTRSSSTGNSTDDTAKDRRVSHSHICQTSPTGYICYAYCKQSRVLYAAQLSVSRKHIYVSHCL